MTRGQQTSNAMLATGGCWWGTRDATCLGQSTLYPSEDGVGYFLGPFGEKAWGDTSMSIHPAKVTLDSVHVVFPFDNNAQNTGGHFAVCKHAIGSLRWTPLLSVDLVSCAFMAMLEHTPQLKLHFCLYPSLTFTRYNAKPFQQRSVSIFGCIPPSFPLSGFHL